uniref:ANK_REP_REGION domain-containing protein n=1 Tax=Macrostomum lignano TaxID=282301 RepID=A0A1I8I7K3_9PLAT
MDENKQKSTVLHYAVENCRLETVRELLNMIKEGQSLQIADKEGNTIFHIAAQRTDKSELLETMLFREGVDIKKALNKRNNKNQSVLHLAIDVTEETSSVKLNIKNIIKEMTKEDLSRTDIEGNTLLHSLMQSKLTYDGFEQHILDRFTLLVSEGVDVEATNNLSLNCLHATKLDALVLCKLLDKVHSDKTARSYFDKLLRAFPRLNTFKHLTHVDSTSELALLDLATFFHRDEILPDLILTRQFELIPCCLSLLIQLEPEIIKMRAKAKGKHEQLLQVKSKITNIAVNALNELFLNANIIEFQLLSKYIKGEMKHKENLALNSEAAAMKKNRDCLGPKFPYRDFKEGKIQYGSVLELVKKADNPDLYATDCIYSVIKEEWRKPISDCSKRGLSGSCLPCDCCHSACSCRPKISRPDSPLARFWTHFVAFIGFLVFFGWYVINFEESFLEPKWDILLVAYLFSFGLQEASEIWRLRKARENCKIGSHVRSVPAYIVDGLNIFDALAILLLLTGLVARWLYYGMGFQLQDAYPSQVVLCVSYSLFCFRSVTFLTYFETIGPMINMLWNLIVYDLLPFLVVLFVIFCCFGVFFVCLLFSNAWTPTEEIATLSNGWETFIQAATLPFNLLFGNFDQIELSYSPDSTELGKVAIKQGYEWFNYFVIFLFMGLVNVVMMNLLIALFNLRVTQIYGVAIGVWRKRFFQMLDEYQELTQFPPPLSFLEYIYNFLMKKFCPKNAVTDDKASRWPNDTEDYPEEYNRFLKFQAIQFRRCRSRLLLDTEWNRNDFDVVKAHTGKELSELKAELQEMLDDANTQGQGKMVE